MATTSENPKVTVAHVIDADQLQRLDALVMLRRTSRSQLMREAVEEYLRRCAQSRPSDAA